jgi:hypothetical protein
MFSLKTMALAGAAVAGLSFYATTEAEARGHRGGGGGGFHRGGGGMHFGGGRHIGGRHIGFHRGFGHRHRHGAWRHGVWVGGLGIATVGASCYRYRLVDTPYGLQRRMINVCGW